MIVYDLLCGRQHRFEGWFASGKDFASQRGRGLVSCPVCASAEVERVPSASRINMGAAEPRPAAPDAEMKGKDPFAIAQMLYSRMLDDLLASSEDVGKEFPSEARRIFYKESATRAIRGQASKEEYQELTDEGIPVARLPIPPDGQWN